MCEISVDGYADAWNERIRTSRKERDCDCCRAPIHVGDRYLYHFSVYEGEPNTGELCLSCERIQVSFGDAHARRVAPADLREFLQECVLGDRDKAAERSFPTKWSSEYAEIQRRYRVSPAGRKWLRSKWEYNALAKVGVVP